jgi:hypothetical protein
MESPNQALLNEPQTVLNDETKLNEQESIINDDQPLIINDDQPVIQADELDSFLTKYRAYDYKTAKKLNLTSLKSLQDDYDKGVTDSDLSRQDLISMFKELESSVEVPDNEENFIQSNFISRTLFAGVRDAALNANEFIPTLPFSISEKTGIGKGGIMRTEKDVADNINKSLPANAAQPNGIVESLAKNFAQFNAAFVPTYIATSKIVKNPVYAAGISAGLSSFLAFKGEDGNIIDLAKNTEFYKLLPDFLQDKENETEFEARLRNLVVDTVTGAAAGKAAKEVVGRVKMFKNWLQTNEAVIFFEKQKNERLGKYQTVPPVDRQQPMTFADMEKFAQNSSVTKDTLLNQKLSDNNIPKTKSEIIGDVVKGSQIRQEAIDTFSTAIPGYRAMLKNGVIGTADNIIEEIIGLKNLDEAVKNRTHTPESMAYLSQQPGTTVVNNLSKNLQQFKNTNKTKLANLLLDVAEMKDLKAMETFTDNISKTSPELFSKVMLDHANYSTLSGMSTFSSAAIANSVIDPFVYSPLQTTVAAGLSTVKSVVSKAVRAKRLNNLSDQEVETLSTKLKDKSFLENYIGRELSKEEGDAFSVGKLKLKEISGAELKLPATVKDDFIAEIANKKIHTGIVGYFTENPTKDTYLKEALIGFKADGEAVADILIHTSKSLAKYSGHKYTANDLVNPGVATKSLAKDAVASVIRPFLSDESIKHVDNLNNIAEQSNKFRIDQGVFTEGVTSDTLEILKHKVSLDPSFVNSLSYKLGQATTWLRNNTVDPQGVLTSLDNIGQGAAQHSTIKRMAYAQAIKTGGDSISIEKDIIAKSLNDSTGNFMTAADPFVREVHKEAIQRGKVRTFTETPQDGILKTLLHDLPNKVDDATSKFGVPLGSVAMLFKKTPINMLTWSFNKLPTAPLTEEFREGLKAGGRKADEVMANWVIGSSVVSSVFALGLDGKIIGSGGGKQERDYRTSLHQPTSNAIKIGDKFYSLKKLQPFSSLLTIPVSLQEIWRMHPEHSDDPELEDYAKQLMGIATLGLGNVISDTANMRGAGELLKAISTGNTEGVGSLLENFAASMAVPAFVNQFTSKIQEHEQIADSLFEKIQTRLGFGTYDKTTFFGEPISKAKQIVPGFVPFEYYPLYDKEKNSPVRKILEGSFAVGYPLVSPKNIHGQSLTKYTPRQYQKMIDILNDGKYMPSNLEYYSALMLDKNGEFSDTFLDLVISEQIDENTEDLQPTKAVLRNFLKTTTQKRVAKAKFLLSIEDPEVKEQKQKEAEEHFKQQLKANENLGKIVSM